MSTALDPWDDAGLLAQRLQRPHVRAYIIIGATQWCSRCRDVRQQFDLYAKDSMQDEIWLWLDLVEHSEFLGDYQPENLPMLVAYEGPQLLTCTEIAAAGTAFTATIDHLRTLSLEDQMPGPKMASPGIRERLLVQDWTVE